jgi:hypothetical protein
MDELGALILGKKPEAKPSVISDQLLDSLKRVESGKDPYAINKQTKAMGAYQFMPETVQMLHKQGVKFNPFDEQEARGAAKQYLEQLVQRNNGDVNKALAQYGGFITKDPSKYVQNVTQGAQQPQQTQQPKQAPDDELGALILGKQTKPNQQGQQNQPMQESTAGGGRGSYAGFDPEAKAIAESQSTRGPRQPEGTALGRMAGNFLGQVQESKRALGEIITAPIAGAVTSVLGPATGIVATMRSGQYGTPEGIRIGEEQSKNLQKQLSPEIRTPQAQAVLGQLQKAFEASKVPPVAMPELAGFAPLVSPAIQQGKQMAGEALQGGKQVASNIGKQLGVGELELQRQFEAKGGQPQIQPQAKAGSIGAAKVDANPYAGVITGEETARGQFPQVKLSKTAKDVPVSEQATRSQIANEILGDTGQVRQGVITGNENLLRNEHTKAKMANPTPEGELYKQQIANEQVALSNYAQKRIENTGASPSLITPYERGERINDAFAGQDGLAGFFKNEKTKLYDDAKLTVGDNPVQSSTLENLINSPQFKAELKIRKQADFTGGLKELLDLHSTQGLEGTSPSSIAGLEKLRQSLNAQWTPDNAYAIRKAVEAIDSDIAKAGGPGLYEKARSLHQAEKVLFGSKGIKQIFGDIDPNGVQTATAFDSIPQKLNSMPLDQWRHIYDTAEKVSKGTINGPIDKATGLPKWTVEVPQELRVSAQSAMAEMRGNLAREIYQAGASKAGEWNQNSVNNILNARADKIKLAFSPEEQKAFHTLNMGGYLMPGIHSYEGAGQQTRRVGMIEGNLGKIGATTGAAAGTAIFGPGVGTAVGGYLGGKAGVAGSEKLANRALSKEAVKSQKEMQKASQLGTKLSDLGK